MPYLRLKKGIFDEIRESVEAFFPDAAKASGGRP